MTIRYLSRKIVNTPIWQNDLIASYYNNGMFDKVANMFPSTTFTLRLRPWGVRE